MGAFDAGGKRTFHLFARAWSEWLLQQEGLEVEAELSGEFQIVTRSTDTLMRVRDEAGQIFLVLTELQTRYDRQIPQRLAAYAALAREKYRLPVYVTVLYLLPPPAGVAIQRFFRSEFYGQVAHQDFDVICLWELNAVDALALDNPALLPFIPLMEGGSNVSTLQLCVERLRSEEDPEELELLLTFFATLVMDPRLVTQITRWNMQMIKESPLYQELVMDLEIARAEAHARGLAEGRAEGYEAALQVLRRFLAFRFQLAETHFDAQLARLDLNALKQLGNVMFDAASLEEFEETLQACVAQAAIED